MARDQAAWLNRVEASCVAGLVGAMRVLPAWSCHAALGGLSRLGYLLMRSRREHAVQLVCERLGLSEPEARHVVKGAFRTLALNVGESILLKRALSKGRLEDHLIFEGAEHLEQAFERKGGVLIATAHLGAWEITGELLARRFRPVWAVGRTMDNPHLDRLVKELRDSALAGTLAKEGSGRSMARLFKKGESVVLLLDQNAGRQGLMMDFLGSPAMQHRVAGVMARRFDVAVVPLYILREPGRLKFRMVLEPPILAQSELPEDEAIQDVVQRVSDSLEARIRKSPEQWLWLHDRWRKARWLLRREQRQAERSKAITPVAAEGTNGS